MSPAHASEALASPTLDRAYALARSGVCACTADIKDRLIREGHGALEVLGLLSLSPVARDLGRAIAKSQRQELRTGVSL